MMRTNRLEAFSDGVLAIAITIMVLELRAPEGQTWRALWESTGIEFLAYVLSFVFIGIYWNNHHHVFQLVERVDGSLLWANLHLLFWLSVLPFTTGWMAETELAEAPTILYGVNVLLAGAAYWLLELTIKRHPVEGARYRDAMGSDRKGMVSMAGCVIGIGAATIAPKLSFVVLVAVAVMWSCPTAGSSGTSPLPTRRQRSTRSPGPFRPNVVRALGGGVGYGLNEGSCLDGCLTMLPLAPGVEGRVDR